MSARNEAVVRQLIERVMNGGAPDQIAELIAADHVGHDPLGDHFGPEGVRITLNEYRAAFPDLRLTIADLIGAGDRVASRFVLTGTHAGPFLGLPPTGRVVTASGIAIDHLVDGRITESWVILDALRLLRQMGASPVLRRAVDSRSSNSPSESETVPN